MSEIDDERLVEIRARANRAAERPLLLGGSPEVEDSAHFATCAFDDIPWLLNLVANMQEQLIDLQSLIPEVEWLEQVAKMAGTQRCGDCPLYKECSVDDGPGEGWFCRLLPERAYSLIIAIRAWRDGDGDGREEQEGESDDRD